MESPVFSILLLVSLEGGSRVSLEGVARRDLSARPLGSSPLSLLALGSLLQKPDKAIHSCIFHLVRKPWAP